jgi:hypothetical protein
MALQVWDLRQANSPIQTLSHFQSGITSLGWCQQVDLANLIFGVPSIKALSFQIFSRIATFFLHPQEIFK